MPPACAVQTGGLSYKDVRALCQARPYVNMRIAVDHQCPVCHSRDIRRSRKTGPLTSLFRALLLEHFRCRRCSRHFFGPRISTKAADRRGLVLKDFEDGVQLGDL
jgi:hypothetical protein